MRKIIIAFLIFGFSLTAGVLKFDHYYPYEEIGQAVKKLGKAYPSFVKVKEEKPASILRITSFLIMVR